MSTNLRFQTAKIQQFFRITKKVVLYFSLAPPFSCQKLDLLCETLFHQHFPIVDRASVRLWPSGHVAVIGMVDAINEIVNGLI